MQRTNGAWVALSSILLMGSLNAFAHESREAVHWDGFYLGGQAGEAWNKAQWTYDNANYFNTLGDVFLGDHFESNAHGFIGGGYVGYGHYAGPLIFGLEGSFLGTDVQSTFSSPFFPGEDEYTVDLQYVATVKARIAIPAKDWLVYLNGGWAGGSLDLTYNDTFNPVKANSTEWANGWTVGAGLEYMLFQHLSIGILYDYFQLYLNDTSISCAGCGTGVGNGAPEVDGNIKTQVLTARGTYYFK